MIDSKLSIKPPPPRGLGYRTIIPDQALKALQSLVTDHRTLTGAPKALEGLVRDL